MKNAVFRVSEIPPNPPNADFSFLIDFKKGEGSASRIFSAMQEFIKTCETFDKDLLASVDSKIKPLMLLEDIRAHSLRAYLRNVLTAVDDDTIKEGDWSKIAGTFLVKAKHLALEWLERGDKDINILSSEINELSRETTIRKIPMNTPVENKTLIDAVKGFDRVKDHLHEQDKAAMISGENENEKRVELDISKRIDIEEIEQLATRETIINTIPNMLLIVKKPDYLGESRWEFKHRTSFFASIEDLEWLRQFQNREIDVRPGDSLRCRVRSEIMHGYNNTIIAERNFIERVIEVVENKDYQPDLFDGEN